MELLFFFGVGDKKQHIAPNPFSERPLCIFQESKYKSTIASLSLTTIGLESDATFVPLAQCQHCGSELRGFLSDLHISV